MLNNPPSPPLKFVQADAILDDTQAKEFKRVAYAYRSVYNYLLAEWHKKKKNLPDAVFEDGGISFLNTKLKNLLTFTEWIKPHEKNVAYDALSELIRNLREEFAGHGKLDAPVIDHERIVFYKQYDAKVRMNSVMMPILGQIRTTRFPYFLGSIRAVGVDQVEGTLVCKIFYRENAPVSSTETAQ